MLINITDFSTVCSDYEIEQFTAIGEELQIAERAALEQMASYLRHRYDTEKAFSATGEERTHIEQMARKRQSVRLTAELMRNTDSLTKKDLKTRTPSVEGERYAPSRGLKSKPGSGEIFSDDHLYFPEDCHICPFGGGLHGLWADLTGRKRGNCMKCKRVQACNDRKTKESERQRIEENKKLYDRLSKDKRYKDVEFNPSTGALKATHIGHNEGRDEGFRLEKNLVNHLYSCGHSIILADEQKKGRDGNVLPSLDMVLDGVRMDIRSITKNKAHYGSAIRAKNNQLIKFNERTDVHEYADTLCMYFDEPKMFSPDKITKGYEYMKSKTSKNIQVHRIICIINSSKGLEIKSFDFE